MAFGIPSSGGWRSARLALLGIALSTSFGHVWRQLLMCLARRRSETAAELNDWLLRDIGVIRERDIGIRREAAAREANNLFWPP